jgi:hypothetical protein
MHHCAGPDSVMQSPVSHPPSRQLLPVRRRSYIQQGPRNSRRLIENSFSSFRTERSGERNLIDSWCGHARNCSLSLEITGLEQPPGRSPRSGASSRRDTQTVDCCPSAFPLLNPRQEQGRTCCSPQWTALIQSCEYEDRTVTSDPSSPIWGTSK